MKWEAIARLILYWWYFYRKDEYVSVSWLKKENLR